MDISIHRTTSISFDAHTLSVANDSCKLLKIRISTRLPDYLVKAYTREDGKGFSDTDNTGEIVIDCFIPKGKTLADVLDIEDAKELLHMIQSAKGDK
jgi:hypothetical protein